MTYRALDAVAACHTVLAHSFVDPYVRCPPLRLCGGCDRRCNQLSLVCLDSSLLPRALGRPIAAGVGQPLDLYSWWRVQWSSSRLRMGHVVKLVCFHLEGCSRSCANLVHTKPVSSGAVMSLSMELRVGLAGDGSKLSTESPSSPSTQTLQAYGRAKEGGLHPQQSSSRVAATASWPLSPTVTAVCQSTQCQRKFLLQSHHQWQSKHTQMTLAQAKPFYPEGFWNEAEGAA